MTIFNLIYFSFSMALRLSGNVNTDSGHVSVRSARTHCDGGGVGGSDGEERNKGKREPSSIACCALSAFGKLQLKLKTTNETQRQSERGPGTGRGNGRMGGNMTHLRHFESYFLVFQCVHHHRSFITPSLVLFSRRLASRLPPPPRNSRRARGKMEKR